MPLGAFRLKRAVLVLAVLALASTSFLSCGYKKSSYYKPPSGLSTRVLASQGVTSTFTFGGLIMLNADNDTLPRVSEIGAGANPGLMALSPTKATLLVFDSSSNTVEVINTVTEQSSGGIPVPGAATSMVIPGTTTIGYAAIPTAPVNGYPAGVVEKLDLSTGGFVPIGVPSARTVLANPNGTQLLVFSNDSNVISVVSPLVAVGPVEQGCDNPVLPSDVCTLALGFDRPVSAIWDGGPIAYVLNCGAECGGTQASIQVLDLSTTPPTAGPSVPVDGATVAFASGSTLYVAGTSPTNHECTDQTTAATTCGRLDIVDLGSMSVTGTVVITDGYHDRIDMSRNGQLFIGARDCTNVGNVNDPSGEVRGCLAILDTTQAGNTTAVIPPDNGDVTGLQSFSSRSVEYVAEGGTLRIYDTTTDALQTLQVTIVGKIIDVKAIDFF